MDGVPVLNGSVVTGTGTLAIHKGKFSLSNIRVIDSGHVWQPSYITEDYLEFNVLSNAHIEIYVIDALVFSFDVRYVPSYTLLATGSYTHMGENYFMNNINLKTYQQREMGHSGSESYPLSIHLGVAVLENIQDVSPICHNCHIERSHVLTSGEFVGSGTMGYVVIGDEVGKSAWVMLGNVLIWYAPTVI